jgi:hypothetical protein
MLIGCDYIAKGDPVFFAVSTITPPGLINEFDFPGS